MLRKVLVLVVAVILSPAAVLFAQHTVTRVGIVARPNSFSGRCPADLEFIATIHVNRPSFVEYQWERSDGARGQRQRVEIRGAGRGVTDRWRLGSGRQHLVVWERLHVLAPTGIWSPAARVAVNCR